MCIGLILHFFSPSRLLVDTAGIEVFKYRGIGVLRCRAAEVRSLKK